MRKRNSIRRRSTASWATGCRRIVSCVVRLACGVEDSPERATPPGEPGGLRGSSVTRGLAIDTIGALLFRVPEGFDFQTHFLVQGSAHESPDRVGLPSGQFY